ncbi:MFS transporter [Solibacillus sp. MA9]|uniref:MFS transporter n=1 Tax=Solibacillus palustris TaxID=2908203 RepID=A0ABS9UCD4_9BACL|nr:MFS transporter [Solibacillus sp. MA9]MCH7322001.1 MFS transporter [Solibacillus sp. MA9]
MNYKKEYFLLWIGQGISRLGSWIYLIALNLTVWHMTESPTMVAGLYMIGPIARIVASFFVGSIVDRSNKRIILILSDVFRAIVVFMIPFAPSIWIIFSFVFLTNISASFAQPSSTFMVTKLVTEQDRPRFNAINSILSSGSFMIGPALSGIIIAMANTSITIWVNSCMLLISAYFMYLLPNISQRVTDGQKIISPTVLRKDFQVVWQVMSQHRCLLQFFVLYSCVLMIAHALDSQEMSFLKDFHHVSDASYGVIVGVTGIGAIVGGIAAASFVRKLSISTYIGAGLLLTLACYTIFYGSPNLILAIIAFILLGFFMSFSNTGYATIYQNKVPTEILGRFTSVLSLFESILQIILTLIIGLCSQWFSIQLATSMFSLLAFTLACVLYRFIIVNKNRIGV